jgi:hypothetical protein
MATRIQQQLIIGIVAAVWLVLALLTGQPLSPTPLKLYSAAGSVVALTLLVYDRYIWRWSVIRRFTGRPLLAGTWRGVVKSSYVHADGRRAGDIRTVIRVTQTASSVTVTLFSAESTSTSQQASLTCLPDGRWSLWWTYENTPRPSVRDRSDRHIGSAVVELGGSHGEVLVGEYFTDRMTRGELAFGEWSPDRFGSAQAALDSTAFQPPRPLVRRR